MPIGPPDQRLGEFSRNDEAIVNDCRCRNRDGHVGEIHAQRREKRSVRRCRRVPGWLFLRTHFAHPKRVRVGSISTRPWRLPAGVCPRSGSTIARRTRRKL